MTVLEFTTEHGHRCAVRPVHVGLYGSAQEITVQVVGGPWPDAYAVLRRPMDPDGRWWLVTGELDEQQLAVWQAGRLDGQRRQAGRQLAQWLDRAAGTTR